MASWRRRALSVLAGPAAGVSAAVVLVGGVAGAGVLTSMARSYAGAAGARSGIASRPSDAPGSRPGPERRQVAVVLGASGSVGADVLAPLDVLARSPYLDVYTISAGTSPVPLSGGLGVVPQHTFSQVTSGALPRPDLIVVPAVVDPAGEREAATRAFVVAQADAGARVLGVCAGSVLLAAAGVLDGHDATSHWWRLPSLESDYPAVHWLRGRRYVQDGAVTTTAGITSGVVGALQLVRALAGDAEAERIGLEVAYPGWSLSAAIPDHRPAPGDLPYALNLAFPWGRPSLAVGIADGVSELDVAAVTEVYDGSSWSASLTTVAAGDRVRSAHGVELVTTPIGAVPRRQDALVVPGAARGSDVPGPLADWARDASVPVVLPAADRRPGESAFEPLLRELARRADRATAAATATFLEYPADNRDWSGPRGPWRSAGLALVTVVAGCAAGTLVARRTMRALAGGRRPGRGTPRSVDWRGARVPRRRPRGGERPGAAGRLRRRAADGP